MPIAHPTQHAFVGVLLTFSLAAPAVAEPFVISTAFGAPLHAPDGQGQFDRVLSQAFGDIGAQVEVIDTPAERGLLNTDVGLDDGDGPRIEGLEASYPNLIRIPERVVRVAFVGFTRGGGPRHLHRWAELAPYDVAIVRGWKILERNIQARSLVAVRTPGLLFGMLARDRADVVVIARRMGWELARREGLDDVRELGPFAERDMFLYLHRRHRALVDPLSRALVAMKRDGRYEAIMGASP